MRLVATGGAIIRFKRYWHVFLLYTFFASWLEMVYENIALKRADTRTASFFQQGQIHDTRFNRIHSKGALQHPEIPTRMGNKHSYKSQTTVTNLKIKYF